MPNVQITKIPHTKFLDYGSSLYCFLLKNLPHQLLTWNGLGILRALFFQEEILPSLLLLSILRREVK